MVNIGFWFDCLKVIQFQLLIMVDVWKIVKGRKKPVRYFEIPEYVREKINELKDWAKHMGGE